MYNHFINDCFYQTEYGIILEERGGVAVGTLTKMCYGQGKCPVTDGFTSIQISYIGHEGNGENRRKTEFYKGANLCESAVSG